MSFRWHCPYCDHKATIVDENYETNRFEFHNGNKYGYQAINTSVTVCPNPDCGEYTLEVSLHDHVLVGANNYRDLNAKRQWGLLPASSAKPMPPYIPAAITADYEEACSIKLLSPKASSTLSRRCLQGMIRDFFGVKKNRLIDEIEAIKDKVDPSTWAAIDAVRQIGNIGAHMEKDIDLIIDVDPDEAQLLINLIESLIQDWYVVRHQREERLRSVASVAATKQEQRRSES